MLGLFFQPSGSGKRGGEDDSVGLSGSLGWTCLLTCLSPPLPGHWPPNHVTHTPVRLYIYEFITKVMQRSVASIDHIYYKAYTKMATVKGWCACVLSHIQLFCDPSMDCSPPGSSVHGILHARILEWVAISFSRGIFPTQGLNPHLLHWQADSLPQSHLRSPLKDGRHICFFLFFFFFLAEPCVMWDLSSLIRD